MFHSVIILNNIVLMCLNPNPNNHSQIPPKIPNTLSTIKSSTVEVSIKMYLGQDLAASGRIISSALTSPSR